MPPVRPRSSFFPVNAIAWHPLCILRETRKRPPMGISSWDENERPREWLLAKGAGALSDAELVAVLLRTGVRGKSAVELARDLLKKYEGVTHMLEAGAELEAVKGLGPAK